MSYVVYRVSCVMCHIPCIVCPMSCSVYHVSYVLCLLSCVVYRLSCVVYLVSCVVYRVSCVVYRVSCLVYRVSCQFDLLLVSCVVWRVWSPVSIACRVLCVVSVWSPVRIVCRVSCVVCRLSCQSDLHVVESKRADRAPISVLVLCLYKPCSPACFGSFALSHLKKHIYFLLFSIGFEFTQDVDTVILAWVLSRGREPWCIWSHWPILGSIVLGNLSKLGVCVVVVRQVTVWHRLGLSGILAFKDILARDVRDSREKQRGEKRVRNSSWHSYLSISAAIV